MHISRTAVRQLFYTSLLTIAITFFGFVGYKDLLFDAAAAAESNISARVIELEETEVKTPEYYGYKRAAIALAEYRKGVIESPGGCNCGPEIDKYTQGHRAQWCTMFASWVANEAGSPLTNQKTKSWRLINSRDFAATLEKTGTWYSREEVIAKGLQPQVGDFVVFWRGDFEDNLGHVDIVADLDGRPGTAGLIGGNLDGRIKYRNVPYLQHYGFLGFGRPEVPEQ